MARNAARQENAAKQGARQSPAKGKSAKKKAAKKKSASGGQSPRRWSAEVTRRSDALDLEQGVFSHEDPKRIAESLKRSAEASKRRKADPYRSAMSMLTFYINRAGKTLSATDRSRLEKAKDELRRVFGRVPAR